MQELNRCEITHSPPRRRYKQLDALQREEISIGVSLGMSQAWMTQQTGYSTATPEGVLNFVFTTNWSTVSA